MCERVRKTQRDAGTCTHTQRIKTNPAAWKKMHVRTRHVEGAKGRGLPATDLEPRRRRRAVDAGAGLLLPQERSAVAPLQEQGGGGVGAEEGVEEGREPRDGERGLGFVEREEGLDPQEE